MTALRHRMPWLFLGFLLLPACTLFYPKFDPYVADRTAAAYEEISFLTSAIEFGKFADPASYADNVDRYIEIDSKLSAASQRVGAVSAPTGASEEARSLLKQQIEDCRARIRSLAVRHRDGGLQPNAGLTAPALVTCDQAVQAATALE